MLELITEHCYLHNVCKHVLSNFFVVVICLHEMLLPMVGVGGILKLQWVGSSEQGSIPSQDAGIISKDVLVLIPCFFVLLFKISLFVSMQVACMRIVVPRKVPKPHLKITVIATTSTVLEIIGRHLVHTYSILRCCRRNQV
jgi:hypothetical protein